MSQTSEVRLPAPYQELVDRLLKLFGLQYFHWVNSYRKLDFSWFTAYVNKDVASETYLMWCIDNDGECFFKMADYELLNVWEPTVYKAIDTLRSQMVLDDVAGV